MTLENDHPEPSITLTPGIYVNLIANRPMHMVKVNNGCRNTSCSKNNEGGPLLVTVKTSHVFVIYTVFVLPACQLVPVRNWSILLAHSQMNERVNGTAHLAGSSTMFTKMNALVCYVHYWLVHDTP